MFKEAIASASLSGWSPGQALRKDSDFRHSNCAFSGEIPPGAKPFKIPQMGFPPFPDRFQRHTWNEASTETSSPLEIVRQGYLHTLSCHKRSCTHSVLPWRRTSFLAWTGLPTPSLNAGVVLNLVPTECPRSAISTLCLSSMGSPP